MEKISIIIPVYKVEAYLEECIDSVCNQSYTNLEIILIDDGSPDNCPIICDEYALKDPRINVIHKENQGLAAARNDGLRIATGDYVAFVDSDDWIDCDMIEVMLNACRKYNADIAICSIRWVSNQKTIEKGKGEIYCCDGKTALRHHLLCENNFFNAVWNKLYKRDVVRALEFPAGKYYEDFIFTVNSLYRSRRCVDIDLPKYNYRKRNKSIMGIGIAEEHIYDLYDLFDLQISFYYDKGLIEEGNICRQRCFSEMIKYRTGVKNTKEIPNKKHHLKTLENRIKQQSNYLHNMKLLGNVKVLFLLYRIHPNLSYLTMALYWGVTRKFDQTW